MPSILIKMLKVKWTLVICIFCYSTYIAAQFSPEFYTLLPTAFILGMGAAPMWSAKCTYLTQVAHRFAGLDGSDPEPVVVKFFGIFFFFFQCNSILGNIISTSGNRDLNTGKQILKYSYPSSFLWCRGCCWAEWCWHVEMWLSILSCSDNIIHQYYWHSYQWWYWCWEWQLQDRYHQDLYNCWYLPLLLHLLSSHHCILCWSSHQVCVLLTVSVFTDILPGLERMRGRKERRSWQAHSCWWQHSDTWRRRTRSWLFLSHSGQEWNKDSLELISQL